MDFDPIDPNQPLEDIVLEQKQPISYQDILVEIEPVVEELSADISGIGPKAAERYLLRYEYGRSTQEIADRENVTPQTISNQVSTVRSKVLKYPRLARVIGSLRNHRATLSSPEINSDRRWSGQFFLDNEELHYELEYANGSLGEPFTWKFEVETTFDKDDTTYHLFSDYIIAADTGVFLKRTQRGISLQSWDKPPLTELFKYSTFPLPNAEIPNTGEGSLISAIEYHLPYDVKVGFSWLLEKGEGWCELENEARSANPWKYGAHNSGGDQLIFQIKTGSENALSEFTQARYIRNNLERIMRMYPFKRPYDLPDETFAQLWNGQPIPRTPSEGLNLVDRRKMYEIALNIDSHHAGRDVRTGAKTHAINTPLWV